MMKAIANVLLLAPPATGDVPCGVAPAALKAASARATAAGCSPMATLGVLPPAPLPAFRPRGTQ